MATYTDVVFKVNDEHLARFRDNLALHYGYQEIIDGEDNPESKTVFIKRKIRQEWIQRVRVQERRTAIANTDFDLIDVTE